MVLSKVTQQGLNLASLAPNLAGWMNSCPTAKLGNVSLSQLQRALGDGDKNDNAHPRQPLRLP